MLHRCAVITCAAVLSLSSVEAATMPDLFAPLQPDVAISVRQWPTDGDPAALRALLVAAKERRDLDSIVAAVPRAGRCAAVLAEWDDLHGRPDALDRLVEAWWNNPAARDAVTGQPPAGRLSRRQQPNPRFWSTLVNDGLLSGWVRRPTPARWQRMREWLAAEIPVTAGLDAPLLRFRFTCGSTWGQSVYDAPTQYGIIAPLSGCRLALAWLALGDMRPVPPVVGTALSRAAPEGNDPGLPTDLRWCDVALWQMQADYAWYDHFYRLLNSLFSEEDGDGGVPTRAQRDALIARLRILLAPFARTALDAQQLEVPSELAACTTAQPLAPGLTPTEAEGIRAVLKQAVALGFPDLVGASVLGGRFRLPPVPRKRQAYWNGTLIRLADGSWLRMDGAVFAASAWTTDGVGPVGAMPNEHSVDESECSLDIASRLRRQCNAMIEPDLFTALARWQNGQDREGRELIDVLLREADKRNDGESPLLPLHATVFPEAVPGLTPPPLPELFRRACALSFRRRAIEATSRTEAESWCQKIQALLPTDRWPQWEASCARLVARQDLPAKAPAGSDLAARMQSWDGQDNPPATRADTGALIALLDDGRATRGSTRGNQPSCLGDHALRALNELWKCDWRLVACHDPMVARMLGARPASWQKGGLPWRTWTADHRHAVASALRRWWQAHGQDGDDTVLAAVVPWLGVNYWENRLARNPACSERVADACAEVLRRLAIPWSDVDDHARRLQDWSFVALRFPTHVGLTAVIARWDALPLMSEFRVLRSAVAAGPASVEAWFDPAFAGTIPAPTNDWAANICHPWHNLGLLADHPTIARRNRLMAVLAADFTHPGMTALLAQLGEPHLRSLGGYDHPRHSTAQAYMAIPAALMSAGLNDQRPLPSVVLDNIGTGSWGDASILAKIIKKRKNIRLCDWAAARFIQKIRYGWPTARLPSGVDEDAQDFIFRPVAERDCMIATLIEQVSDLAQETAEKASLIATPNQDASNRF